ncbi:MAG TPA: glycoside hydrolase family 97 N-terminal domain-containing protein [Gemmatimonadaceae bacterium]
MRPRTLEVCSLLLAFSSATPTVRATAQYIVKSPDGKIALTVRQERGALTFSVSNGKTRLIDRGTLGLTSSRGDFTNGLRFVRQSRGTIDETYSLPIGKRSTYVNRANELDLAFAKGAQELHVVLRAYDDGVAFRYVIPGTGDVDIASETTTFPLAGTDVAYWGQPHPNNYGYETPLGPVTADRISMPVLAELKDRKHWLLVAQAASYGSYIIPNFARQGNTLAVRFPMDQKTPVRTTLPFASPWRVVIVSPSDPGRIVESTMLENLNPPTEPALRNASWIRPGRASWDFIAGDGKKLGTWIDFDAEMGWEWHVTDAGWQTRTPHMLETTAYAAAHDVAIMAWGKVANRDFLYRRDSAEAWMSRLERLGIRGAKIDFFDQQDSTATATDDLEDTQARLQLRDFLTETAAKHHLMVEYHGAAIPSGERRRWPNLASAEAVYGLERRNQNLVHDLTIPYVRNAMGPVSYTPFHLTRSAGSLAYQLGQTVIYETGIQIFAERYDRILGFAGAEFLKALPVTWDETRLIEGAPGSHTVIARRKGKAWFVGGISGEARTVTLPLSFLEDSVTYDALIHRDGAGKADLVIENRRLVRGDTLALPTLAAGGFAMWIAPKKS